jgi:hypothetical protein
MMHVIILSVIAPQIYINMVNMFGILKTVFVEIKFTLKITRGTALA